LLKRIVRVDDFRAMEAWSPSVEFSKVNLVFGSNGSGKSTFASLFEQYPRDPDGVGSVQVEVVDELEQSRVISSVDDNFWPGVRVFNRDYVQRSIRFDGAAGPNATALMTLGKRQVEAEARRIVIQERLKTIPAEQVPFQRELDSSRRGMDQLLTRTAQSVGQELQAGGAHFNPRTYRAPNVRALLQDRQALSDNSSANVEEDLVVVTMPAMSTVAWNSAVLVNAATYTSALQSLLARTITSVPISELENQPRSEAWVQSGIALHADRETCLFCGEPLQDARMSDLAHYFDASLIALQQDLAALRTDLERSITNASTSLNSLPVSGLLLESFRERYESSIAELNDDVAAHRGFAEALIAVLDDKSTHLFSEVFLPELPSTPILSFDVVSSLIEENNTQLIELDRNKLEASTRIENSRVLAISNEIDGYETSVGSNQGELDRLQAERQALVDERDALPTSELDPLPLATSLNDDLAYLLGRDELRFTVVGDQYEIQRGGESARHLSEGERTAISLLYFLSSLHGHEVETSRLTVVIDDPVSSLDSSVLVGASSHLWRRLVESDDTQQVFILTHNFDLFRMWSNQFDHRSSVQRRTRSTALFEMRMKATTVAGVSRRSPLLSEWPTDINIRKRIRSEYHYLFWRLAHTLEDCRLNPSIESDIDAASILPNVARRVLEGFLAFKYPEMIDNFEGAVMRANESADPVTQQRIVRFLHQYSHNGEADTGRNVPRPESVTILTSVFDLMRTIDSDHLHAMCIALDVDENQVTTPVSQGA